VGRRAVAAHSRTSRTLRARKRAPFVVAVAADCGRLRTRSQARTNLVRSSRLGRVSDHRRLNPEPGESSVLSHSSSRLRPPPRPAQRSTMSERARSGRQRRWLRSRGGGVVTFCRSTRTPRYRVRRSSRVEAWVTCGVSRACACARARARYR
jgi:hypothetical protein